MHYAIPNYLSPILHKNVVLVAFFKLYRDRFFKSSFEVFTKRVKNNIQSYLKIPISSVQWIFYKAMQEKLTFFIRYASPFIHALCLIYITYVMN